LLESPLGIAHRYKRCVDVETVFANIKSNHGFRRFTMRSLAKVEIEFGLLVLAQNLRKRAKAKHIRINRVLITLQSPLSDNNGVKTENEPRKTSSLNKIIINPCYNN
jgi:hypothetical protein